MLLFSKNALLRYLPNLATQVEMRTTTQKLRRSGCVGWKRSFDVRRFCDSLSMNLVLIKCPIIPICLFLFFIFLPLKSKLIYTLSLIWFVCFFWHEIVCIRSQILLDFLKGHVPVCYLKAWLNCTSNDVLMGSNINLCIENLPLNKPFHLFFELNMMIISIKITLSFTIIKV